MENSVFVFFATLDDEQLAGSLSQTLVREGLVACVNVVPGIQSHYLWEGKLECSQEFLLILKTTEDRIPALRQRFSELHPYEVPELIGWPVKEGLADYLDWVRGSTQTGGK